MFMDHVTMDQRIILLTLLLFYLTGAVSQGGCYKYTNLDDTTMLDNFTGTPNPAKLKEGWYRITSSLQGVMARSCPKGNVCGTTQQAWLSDPLPDRSRDTPTNVTICIRHGDDCCVRKFTIEMVNCFVYLVFHLIPLDDQERYCFYAHTKDLAPVSTTTSPDNTTTQTLPMISEDTSSPPIVLIAGVAVGVLLAMVVAFTAILVRRRHKYKTRPDLESTMFGKFGVGRQIFDISTMGTDILINRRLANLVNVHGQLGAKRRMFNSQALDMPFRPFSAPPGL